VPGGPALAAVNVRRGVAWYLVAQAAVGLALWAAAAASDTVHGWFALVEDRPEVTAAFFFADLVIVAGSLAGAYALRADREWALPVVAFTAGAVVYPTTYLLGWSVLTDGGGSAALAVMLAPATLSCWVTWLVWRARVVDRPAQAAASRRS